MLSPRCWAPPATLQLPEPPTIPEADLRVREDGIP